MENKVTIIKPRRMLLFLAMLFIATSSFSKSIDSTQYLVFNNIENEKVIKFKNNQKISIWTAEDAGREINGKLSIINDTLIEVGHETISIHQIVAFEKSKKSQKGTGNLFMAIGASGIVLGSVGIVITSNSNPSSALQEIMNIIVVFLYAGVIATGTFLGISGLLVRLAAESDRISMRLYESEIKWVYD